MKCNNTSKLIIDKLAGELSPRQASKLDKHLAACEACRKEFEELSKIWQFSDENLKTDTFVKKLTPTRRSEIFNAAKNEAKRKQPSWLLTRFAEYAFVIAICLVLAGMLLPALNKPRTEAKPESSQIKMTQAKFLKARKEIKDENTKSDNDIVRPALAYAPDIKKSKAKKYRRALASPAPPSSACSNEVQSHFAVKKQTRARISKERLEMKCKADVSKKAPVNFSRYKAGKAEAASFCRNIQVLPKKTFKLNLKRWNMTTVADVRKYLKDNNYPIPNDIKVYKTKNMIIIHAPDAILKKIDKLFKKLNEKEKELEQ